ncbi:MAG: helix-turn-helix domain-containing protein, partial [Phycisphaeraceae bacterium]
MIYCCYIIHAIGVSVPPSKSPSSIPSDFAEQIKTLRGQLGLTQAALAERLGVSYVTVNRWENEQSTPSALG